MKNNVLDFKDTDERDSKIRQMDSDIVSTKFKDSDDNQAEVLKWKHTKETNFQLLSKIIKSI